MIKSSLIFEQRHLMSTSVFVLAAIFCLTPWASAFIALPLGAALTLTICHPLGHTGQDRTELLLQICVVLLGLMTDVAVLRHAAAVGSIFAAVTVLVTLGSGMAVGWCLGLCPRESLLIALGTAVCGGSAINAASRVAGHDEADKTVALGVVFVLNTVALYLFPVVGHAAYMGQGVFGTWSGLAIHDVTSVVGAAESYGDAALQTAMVVKLCRVIWIAPLILMLARLNSRRSTSAEAHTGPRFKGIGRWPVTIVLFVLASLVHDHLPGLENGSPLIKHVVLAGLTLTLFLVGATMSRQTLNALTWRPMVHGVVLWTVVSVVCFVLLRSTATWRSGFTALQ